MAIAQRLKRLEASLSSQRTSGHRSFEERLNDYARLWDWLKQNDFEDALEALESNAVIPPEMEADLRRQAVYDPRHRAFARVEAALGSGRLPEDADLQLLRQQKLGEIRYE